MNGSVRVFVGYFRSDLKVTKIQAGLKDVYPKILSLRVKEKSIGVSGTVKWARVTFSSEFEAHRAVKLFNASKLRGHLLKAHVWSDRTSANERRRPDWRTAPWNGLERRRLERRDYRKTEAPPPGDSSDWLNMPRAPGVKVNYNFGDEVFFSFRQGARKTQPNKPDAANHPEQKTDAGEEKVLSESDKAFLEELNKVLLGK